MTLTTHSIIAAAITRPLIGTNPLIIFLFAITSHYLSDAIPHWDYPLKSIEDKENKEKRHFGNDRRALIKDIAFMALDGFLGLGIVLLIIRPTTYDQWIWALTAIIGGCLPDFLQGLYMLKLKFLRPHQTFHDIFHTNIRLGPYPLFGIPCQMFIVLVALYLLI